MFLIGKLKGKRNRKFWTGIFQLHPITDYTVYFGGVTEISNRKRIKETTGTV